MIACAPRRYRITLLGQNASTTFYVDLTDDQTWLVSEMVARAAVAATDVQMPMMEMAVEESS